MFKPILEMSYHPLEHQEISGVVWFYVWLDPQAAQDPSELKCYHLTRQALLLS